MHDEHQPSCDPAPHHLVLPGEHGRDLGVRDRLGLQPRLVAHLGGSPDEGHELPDRLFSGLLYCSLLMATLREFHLNIVKLRREVASPGSRRGSRRPWSRRAPCGTAAATLGIPGGTWCNHTYPSSVISVICHHQLASYLQYTRCNHQLASYLQYNRCNLQLPPLQY